jgi:hypothetical protein
VSLKLDVCMISQRWDQGEDIREHIVIIDGSNKKDPTLDGGIGHRDLGWPYISTPSKYEQ